MRHARSLAARCRWLMAGETLGLAPPGSPPPTPTGPGLREFFLQPGRLPDSPPGPPDPPDQADPAPRIDDRTSRADAPPADHTAAARPAFWRWLFTPERLPQAAADRHPDPES